MAFRATFRMLLKDRAVNASLLVVLVGSVLLSALARRYDVSAPLVLAVAGLAVGLIPGVPTIELDPDLVLFVVLPPLLWSAGVESSYVALRKNLRPIGLLAVGLPLATTFAVGFVAYRTVPDLTLASALTLGAIVAPPDAVSATAIGRRLGLPRPIMTLLGGESLLNDATALTAYKVSLGAAIGTAASWGHALGTFVLAAAGGVAVGGVFGAVVAFIRSRLDDPLVESGIGLVAPFVTYLLAEEIHGSGVLAVVVAALILGQRSTRASYATRLQDQAVWKALQLLRGVVSLAAAFAVPMTTLSGAPFPGRPYILFLTFVLVIGTLLLHGLTLPWLIRLLGVQGTEAQDDLLAEAAAQDKAARAAAQRLGRLLEEQQTTDVHGQAARILRGWNTRRRNAAWERLGRHDDDIGESPASAFRRLRLEMLDAERKTFIDERDRGRIDDEVLRSVLRGLDLEEATLNRIWSPGRSGSDGRRASTRSVVAGTQLLEQP